MIIPLVGVLRNFTMPPGTVPPKIPYQQDLNVPRGEDLTIRLRVIGQDFQPIDITGATIKLGLRQYSTDADDLLAATAVPDAGVGGTADITIASSVTLPLHEFFAYVFDVQMTADGKRSQIVPASPFRITPIVNRPGD